jgi:hypothetical protein
MKWIDVITRHSSSHSKDIGDNDVCKMEFWEAQNGKQNNTDKEVHCF